MWRFLVNPASGGGRARRFLPLLERRARALGAEVEISEGGDDLTARAARAVDDGVERLVVCGGDGTVHLAIQAVAGTPCELAVLPVGRGNDFAISLEIPLAFTNALELATSGQARPIDLGRAGDRWFDIYGGGGFDSAVTRVAEGHPRWWPDRATYVIGMLRVLSRFEAPEASVVWDGGSFEGRVMFATVCNAPFFGGGMNIAPGASMRDGKLDLVLVREVGRAELLRVFPRVYRGSHADHPAIDIHRTRRVSLAMDPPALLGCDGEVVGTIGSEPVTFEARPAALAVVHS